jgi:hypothetical protein
MQTIPRVKIFSHHHHLGDIFIFQQHIHRQVKTDGARPNVRRIMIDIALPGSALSSFSTSLRFRLRRVGRKRQADQQLWPIRGGEKLPCINVVP